jgi:hypothetical protein
LEGVPEPIPYREIILTTQIMDAIFRQLDVPRSGGPCAASGINDFRSDQIALKRRPLV